LDARKPFPCRFYGQFALYARLPQGGWFGGRQLKLTKRNPLWNATCLALNTSKRSPSKHKFHEKSIFNWASSWDPYTVCESFGLATPSASYGRLRQNSALSQIVLSDSSSGSRLAPPELLRVHFPERRPEIRRTQRDGLRLVQALIGGEDFPCFASFRKCRFYLP
jgi:hypothetical protein